MPRPKQFDPDEALERAMQLFWSRGFEATSLSDLEETMEINRFSIYATFGDKRALFLAALDLYRDRIVSELLAPLERGDGGLDSIRLFFDGLSRGVSQATTRMGCLMVNCVAEPSLEDPETARRIEAHFERVHRAFTRALIQARRRGTLRLGLTVPDLSAHLVVVLKGVLAGVRLGESKRRLRGAIRVVLNEVDSWKLRGRQPRAQRARAPRR